MSKPTIELVWIVVKDLKKSIQYYTDVIGFEVLVMDEDYGWAEVGSSSGARLGLAQANEHMEMAAGGNAVITLTVKDIAQSTKNLLTKGAKLLGEAQEVPGHVRLQMLQDLDGNKLQLVQML